MLAPGERLPSEVELAAQLGVAPMTLRQALQILRAAGFVETRRGRTGGSFVRDDPPAALVLDERAADARRAARADRLAARDLGRGRRARRRARRARARATSSPTRPRRPSARSASSRAFRLADARFHIAVAEASGSRRLVAAETQIQVETAEMLRVVPGPRLARAVSQASHDPIVAAIARKRRRRGPNARCSATSRAPTTGSSACAWASAHSARGAWLALGRVWPGLAGPDPCWAVDWPHLERRGFASPDRGMPLARVGS